MTTPRTGGSPLPQFLLSLVGLLAAGTLVWFVGPLIALAGTTPLAGEGQRWIVIAAMGSLAVMHTAWRAIQAARNNRRLMEGMASAARREEEPQAPPGGADASVQTPGEQEVALLGERFERAVGMLKRRRVGGRGPLLAALTGRPYVYELPWYIIIGAPGAGKTTALANSGLEFPLASQLGKKVIRGVGGTRNCDWWFAADAVLIDTAGRYTTHDSDRATDRAAWLGFLSLLKQYRPARPINGVLLTISVSDLLNSNEGQRLAHARALRERIEELHAQLGIRFPIYVMVTKTDLLAGFMEFFADFDKDERAQVWGVTFPYDTELSSDDPLARMASDFAALEKLLNQCLIDRLHAEHDRERRPAVYAFPQQWAVLRVMLLGFLQAVFAEANGGLRPLMRGVYFTSATQEGTPIDRAIGGLARALGLSGRLVAPARPSGKTFFVTRLLREVVLSEAGLAGTDLRWRRRRARLRWALAGATACVTAGAVALAWFAYQDSRARIAAVAERMADLGHDAAVARNSAPTDLVALLPSLQSLQALEAVQAATRASDEASQHRWSWLSMGLGRGEMLAAAAHDAYERLLKEVFLPRVAARLEERLRAASPEHVERIYEDLKAYLMLFGGKNFDKAALRAFLGADW
ncbi:MAG TPA: type VI secretion system membrane subunit TssM, partial [Methylibium sp.]